MNFRSLKQTLDQVGPSVIEKIGNGVNPLILKLKNEKDRLLIFYFHGVYQSEEEKNAHHVDPQNNVTIAQLREFVDYFISANYHFCSPQDLIDGLEPGQPYVMMTFDDGYFNNSYAIQVLEEFKVPATFFITANNVLNNYSYWWDVVYKYRKKDGVSLTDIRNEQEELKKHSFSYIESYLIKNFGQEARVPWSDIDRPFTASELKDFSDHPLVHIGNHTFNHTLLNNYSRSEIKQQLVSCNRAIDEITGSVPTTVAFPNGNYDQIVIEVAKEVGFRYVFTVRPYRHRLLDLSPDKEFVCLHRFMMMPPDIRETCNFFRIGYHPKLLYEKFKDVALSYRRWSLLNRDLQHGS